IYDKNRLLTDIHLNYQSKIKEIIRISNYLLQISERQTFSIIEIIDLQLQSIKICIEKKDNVIDSKFNEITCHIISLIKDIFKTILENKNIKPMKSEILKKYETFDLEVALRGAVYKRNI
ncbi:unnamed protein product, partial [Rotaria sp. Silwood2]